MSLANNQRAISCTTSEQLSVDDSTGIRSCRFDDYYYHPQFGAAESRYVFIDGNQLEQRWRSDVNNKNVAPNTFVIGETGFGTGLNFLATWQLWQEIHNESNIKSNNKPRRTLYYYSTERYPLTRAAMEKAIAHYNPFGNLARQLIDQYPDPLGGDYLLEFDTDHHCDIKLVLLFGESTECLSRLEHYPDIGDAAHLNPGNLKVDAWFLDGFSPPKNPDMWQEDLFSLIARHSDSRTTAATFSVARQVRDQFKSAGFTIDKRPGFNKKRETLTAKFTASGDNASKSAHNNLSPCYYRYSQRDDKANSSLEKPGRALIIGAGIAGCCISYKLARQGWDVQLADNAASIANAASGNQRAVLYARTSQQRSALADFHEASFHYAINFYQALGDQDLTKGLNGMIKLNEQLSSGFLADNPELYSRKNILKNEASAIAGMAFASGGIYYRQSGWLEPRKICAALCEHANIHFRAEAHIETLRSSSTGWHAQLSNRQLIDADIVVIATGAQANTLTQTHWLPLKAIRGQTTQLPTAANSRDLLIAMCDRGYLTPAHEGFHEIGATYTLNEHTLEAQDADNIENINKLVDMLAAQSPLAVELTALLASEQTALHASKKSQLVSRVAQRCVSPDYLPLAGPVVNAQHFLRQFSSLKKNAKQTPERLAEPEPGLFVSTGYGSHGFTTAPLASEILLAQIEGTAIPFGDKLRQSIAPARFLVRQLIRGK